MYASIQCLSISLSVLLVLCTGLLVGVLGGLTAEAAIDRAWRVGDRNIDLCMSGATGTTNLVGGRLLGSILKEVEVDIQGFLKHPRVAYEQLAHLYRVQNPLVSLSKDFTDKTIRPIIASIAQTAHSEGIVQLLVETEFGMVASTLADESIAHVDPDADPIFLTAESSILSPSSGEYVFGYDPVNFGLGTADGFGNIPNRTGCTFGYDYVANPQGSMGYCHWPWAAMVTSDWVTLHNHAYKNYKTSSDHLDTPDEVHYSPISEISNGLSIFSYGAWTNSMISDGGYPRRAGRGGMVKVAFTVKEVSRIMQSQNLPEGSWLYAVQHNQWTGHVGTLVGVSEGVYQTTVKTAFNYDQAAAIDVTNHTLENGDPTPVARHGAYVSALQGGYKNLARNESNLANGHDVWVDVNTTYWCLTLRVVQRELTWYTTLMVPREAIMSDIDETLHTIEETRTNEKNDANNDMATNYMIMICVTVVTAVGFLVMSVILVMRIIKPLHELEGDMANVAVMRLEAVQPKELQSHLAEVARMQASFRTMVKNLVEYKNYMPQSVLVSEDDDASTTYSETSNQQTVLSNSRYSMSTGVLSSENRCSGGGNGVTDDILRKKTVSITSLNLTNWHQDTHRFQDSEIVTSHGEYVSTALSTVQSHKGVPETFLGDRIMVSFNAVLPCSGHRLAAVNTAVQVRQAVFEKTGFSVSFSCTSGEGKVGNMGCSGMKRFTIMSVTLPWAAALESVNKTRGTQGLIDHQILKDCDQKYLLRCVDAVEYKKRSLSLLKIYEVVRAMQLKEQEWMYQLNDMANNPYGHWNTAFDMILDKDFDAAEQALNKFKRTPEDGDDKELVYVKGILRARRYTPLSIGFH